MTEPLKAPFPYFGGKSRVAAEVWSRFGPVQNYVEPFFGSGAVLLGRPQPWTIETVNDKDCFLANFWRAVSADPEGLAKLCDWPINECDLEARHWWLVTEGANRLERCKAEPDYFDLQAGAWWVWGLSQWIGAGWCAGLKQGAWKKMPSADSRRGVLRSALGPGKRKPSVGKGGDRGINRCSYRPWKQMPHLSSKNGIQTKMPRLGGWANMGIAAIDNLKEYFLQIQARFRLVRVCCGDWERVCQPSSTTVIGTTAVFLDPPYTSKAGRNERIYRVDSTSVGFAAAAWAFENGNNPLLRIALCGYEGEYEDKLPPDWRTFSWKAMGGHSNQAGSDSQGFKNRIRERIHFSPHCLEPQPTLFDL